MMYWFLFLHNLHDMYLKKYFICLALFVWSVSKCVAQDTIPVSHDTIVSVNEPVQSIFVPLSSKQPVYKLNLPVDLPITAITTGVTIFGFSKIYNKDKVTLEEVNSLNPKNVNRFDRSAIKHYNESATKAGDYIFYSSMPLPLLFLLDNKMRKDFPKLATLYLEAMGATGIIYVSAVHFGDRYRPYVYNPDVPLDQKLRGGSRNSFFAGHPALVGTATFFMASAYAAYHPESKIKWVFYAMATATTAGVATARYLGGWHFPSDLIIGVSLGTLSGILIPQIHKNKDLSKRKTAVMPFFGESSGLVLVHKL
jgi:membrane-associated phospholipid phosphatase